MSEVDFRESGVNERIEPLPTIRPLHLHERSAAGVTSTKDPTANILTGGQYSRDPFRFNLPEVTWPEIPPFVFTPPMLFDPIFPPFEPPPMPPGPIEPGPGEEGQTEPPTPPTPGGFMYWNGAWWAGVELDCTTGELGDPYWYQFAPNCDGGGFTLLSMPAPAALVPDP